MLTFGGLIGLLPIDGYKYFFTIVDDFSRATWVHLFAHKSNALSLSVSFIAYIEVQFKASVKIIRSDNGMEFDDTTTRSFYSTKGIVHQTTCIGTPQQNGVIERKHRHLLETARALLFQSKLPIKYWDVAITNS